MREWIFGGAVVDAFLVELLHRDGLGDRRLDVVDDRQRVDNRIDAEHAVGDGGVADRRRAGGVLDPIVRGKRRKSVAVGTAAR